MSDLKQDAGIDLLWSPVIGLLDCSVLLKISLKSWRILNEIPVGVKVPRDRVALYVGGPL